MTGETTRRRRLMWHLALGALVALTRLAIWSDFPCLNKDTALYFTALDLDPATNAVPMPGSIGYVLLARAIETVQPDRLAAYQIANLLLSVAAVAFFFEACRLVLHRFAALLAAAALAVSPIPWLHAPAPASYLGWWLTYSALAYFGLLWFVRRDELGVWGLLLSWAVGSWLRPELLFFAAPFVMTALWMERPPRRLWISALAWAGLIHLGWLLASAWSFGGIEGFSDRVLAKASFASTFGLFGAGWIEGVLRNSVKYALFVTWSIGLWIVPAALAMGALHRGVERRRTLFAVLAFVGPMLAYSLFVFSGAISQVFPVLLVAIGGGAWFVAGRAPASIRPLRRALAILALLALAGGLQFVGTPLLPEQTEADVIWNVQVLRLSLIHI